ncbi:mitochondrial nucleoid-associated protein 1 isoform 2-T2 [Mantella aurantiaca]
METCPFCGKAFKRLKTHLPHCKQASAKSDSNATEQAKKSPKSGTRKALLEAETKEQYIKNEGNGNMDMAKKTQLIKKKNKHLESSFCRTEKTTLKEKENVKKAMKNSHLDQVHGKNHLIDKEENRSSDCPIKGLTTVTISQSPEVATSLLQKGPVHVSITQSQTSARKAFPEGSETLKASWDNLTWPRHKEEFREAMEEMGSISVKSTLYRDVSKAQVNSYLIGKEGNISGDGPTKGPTTMGILQCPEVATSLVQTGSIHPEVIQSQTSAGQTMPGSSETLKASEEKLSWPNHKEEFKHAVEKIGSVGVKSLLYEDVSKAQNNSQLIDKGWNRSDDCPVKGPTTVTISRSPEVTNSFVRTDPNHVAVTQFQTSAHQALSGSSGSLQASEDNSLNWPSHKEEFRGAVEKTGSTGYMSSNEDVSKIMADGRQGDNHSSSFGNGFKGSFHEEHYQKPENQHLEIPSEPGSSFLLSTMVSSSYSLHCEHAQLPDMSCHLQTHNFEALKSTKKSLQGRADLTPANKIETLLPVRDVSSRNCFLGLQWIPELHSNYVQLKIVPEKMDLMSSNRNMSKAISPGPADNPEFCKPQHHQLIPKVPLTSRRLMDVRIRELSSWLALQRLSMKTIPELGQRGCPEMGDTQPED